jgi:beta-glucosidase
MNTPELIRAHNECTEGEAWDRGDIKLCGQQQAILETALKPGKPLISVMINGGSIAATWIKEHSAAVLEAWYPGQAGGEAVAAVLFGDHNPGGRLPVTIYDETLVKGRNITDMSLRSAEGLTYMHYRGTPLWPFGFGLSYTRWSTALGFESEAPSATTTADVSAAYAAYYSDTGLAATPVHTLTLHVTNEGQRASDVVVQVFAVRLSPLTTVGALSTPVRQLAGFSRASALVPGESRAVSVDLAPLPFCVVDGSGDQWVEPATWRLAATVDGVAMLNTTLVVNGARQRVLEWPDRSP